MQTNPALYRPKRLMRQKLIRPRTPTFTRLPLTLTRVTFPCGDTPRSSAFARIRPYGMAPRERFHSYSSNPWLHHTNNLGGSAREIDDPPIDIRPAVINPHFYCFPVVKISDYCSAP